MIEKDGINRLRELAMAAVCGPYTLRPDWVGDDLKGHIPLNSPNHMCFAQITWVMDDDADRGAISPKCQATAQFMSAVDPQTVLDLLDRIEQLENVNKAPRCPGYLFRFAWDAGLSEDVVCHLEFHEEEIGSRENGTGLQLEPDIPEYVILQAAYVRGLNISALLSPEQVLSICSMAMKQIKREAEQDKEPT